MSQPSVTLLQLYPRDMNIYGDWGNVLVLKRRLEWYGYDVDVIAYNPGDKFPKSVDLIVGGGGQDSGQEVIQSDLRQIGHHLKEMAINGTPMLAICGLYQLFGKFFKTNTGKVIEGIGLLDIETHAGPERLIGNSVVHSGTFGEIIGYENHSGQTFLGSDMQPLGKVIKGAGNNGVDETEGVVFHNVIGTYLHGSLLPKNPLIADYLIEKAMTKKFGSFNASVIDDRFADLARRAALKRPR